MHVHIVCLCVCMCVLACTCVAISMESRRQRPDVHSFFPPCCIVQVSWPLEHPGQFSCLSCHVLQGYRYISLHLISLFLVPGEATGDWVQVVSLVCEVHKELLPARQSHWPLLRLLVISVTPVSWFKNPPSGLYGLCYLEAEASFGTLRQALAIALFYSNWGVEFTLNQPFRRKWLQADTSPKFRRWKPAL